MHARSWWGGMAIAWIVGVSWLAIDCQKPPPVLALDAPENVFSAVRAQKHVAEIARAPHPTGSAESKRVREFLLRELAHLGLKPRLQVPVDSTSEVRNVVARLSGKGVPGKKALMLCAHYDSVSASPGAGDDASGVAVVLETLRALKAGSPPDRDVVVLFDDGEEDGFLGSVLFVNEHPWAREVGVVINLDARGNSGPSIMFETSDDNGWLIRQYAQAVPHPLATSASMDIYEMLPNGTDLTIFKQAGMAGLNFAFSGGLAYYHTPEDTLENLDLRTLQHQGENALAMARQLGQLDLDAPRREDFIYTSILSRFVLAYPVTWALPLGLLVASLFLAVLSLGARTGQLTLADAFAGAGVLLLAICAALLTLALLFLLGFIWDILSLQFHGTRVPWLKFDVPILSGCAMLIAIVTLALKRWSAGARSLLALSFGALSWWLVLTLITAWWLPGSSYLFVWPTLFGVLGLGVSLTVRVGATAKRMITLLCATPALLLFPPLFRNMFDGLSLELAPPGMILVVLFLGTLLPVLEPFFVAQPTWHRFATVPSARARATTN